MKYLYGIQPTGRIHIGNYLGGLKLAIEKKADVLIAVHHAMTSNGGKWIEFASADFVGQLDKLGATYFYQENESVPLSWKIQCLTPMSDLNRMTQFKNKGEGNVGLLTYPCLMAADIILANPDFVIVGEDQMQHMEFYRRTCKRMGIKKVARTILTDTPRIMSIKDPSKKMSKSLGDEHCLYLGDHEDNKKKVMKAPTTPEGIENLRTIAKGIGADFDEGNMKRSKENIIQALPLIYGV